MLKKSGIEAIEQGNITATFNLNPIKAGIARVDYIDEYLTDSNDKV